MLAELRAGMISLADGAINVLRGDKTGAVVMTQAHGNYCEPSTRGVLMTACNAVAGIAPGTALSTTPPMCIWNPPSSGKNLSILKTALGYVSGTLGAGTVVYATYAAQTTVPTTGTELVPQNELIGFPRGVGRAFAGSTIGAAGTILRPSYIMGAFLATTAIQPVDVIDVVDGSIVVAQGTCFIMQGIAAAGTTPLVIMSVTWEEVPI
jgi:hypothetical protein